MYLTFSKNKIGGLIDEEPIPEKFISLFKQQMLQQADADKSDETKSHGVHYDIQMLSSYPATKSTSTMAIFLKCINNFAMHSKPNNN